MHTPTLLLVRDDLVAVDKPSGWLVHPAGTEAPDLLAWLADQDVPAGLAPVHRLDRGTSGITLFAPPAALPAFTERFAQGEVSKRYDALVFGATRPKGTVRRKLADGRRGKPVEAVTRYRTVEQLPRCSLLSVRPQTGRKHQIRRHLQGIGHAIVGDERYPPRGKRTVPAFPGRLWLHAASLQLDDLHLEAPLPEALRDHLAVLRERKG
jgi:23S rRNA-/tRNA-specific pseudouridylate synthase